VNIRNITNNFRLKIKLAAPNNRMKMKKIFGMHMCDQSFCEYCGKEVSVSRYNNDN
jgi:hypothetical protein